MFDFFNNTPVAGSSNPLFAGLNISFSKEMLHRDSDGDIRGICSAIDIFHKNRELRRI
jgi:hypothetical protein